VLFGISSIGGDSIPRKAPDKVIEHRISLSNYERDRLDRAIELHKRNSVVSNVTDSLQSVSFPLIAGAALFYVGFSLTEIVEDAKKWYNKFVDGASDYIAKSRLFNYTSDEIGREIEKNEEAKVALYEEAIAFYNGPIWSGAPQPVTEDYSNFNSSKGRNYRSKLEALEKRDQVLRKILNDIATGKSNEGWLSNVRSPKEQADYLQELYESEGGTGQLNWEINRDDSRIYDEDGNWIGQDDRV